jgi:peptide/nickel transport system permease protein
MKVVVLYSDALIYLMVVLVSLFFVSLRHNEQARKKWRVVFTSRSGMLSFLVMMFYLFLALLDSFHYQKVLPPTLAADALQEQAIAAPVYASEVSSLLDDILAGLKNNAEVTYSRPFAIHSFAMENQYDTQSKLYRAYPRLLHAGSQIAQEENVAADVWVRSAIALGEGLLLALLPLSVLALVRQRVATSQQLPWPVIYGAVTTMVVASAWVLKLGAVYHIFGTDRVGVDVLYQSLKAVRTGILIGSLATLLTLPFSIGLGIAAGYFKGIVDDAIQYLYTTLSSIPDILLIAAAVLVLDVYIEAHAEHFALFVQRSDFKFLTLCFILGITSWTGLCRLLRAETLKVSQLEYVQAARAFGVSHSGIILRHILPNVMHLVLISMVLNFSGFVLAEAVLSYIGVGVDSSMFSWGNMINGAREELSRDPTVWWTIVAAFLSMFTLVLSANVFADRVRDAFDPRHVAGRKT